MEEFPFSEVEWQRVQEASHSVVNATLADDAVLRSALLVELLAILAELRAVHGDHPVLLETEADFLDDPSSRVAVYRDAIRLAQRHALPTISIRLSLARTLLEDLRDPRNALAVLSACQGELHDGADEADKADWNRLVTECAVARITHPSLP
jgi:hypothetical protein